MLNLTSKFVAVKNKNISCRLHTAELEFIILSLRIQREKNDAFA